MSLDLTIPCPRPFRGVELVVYAERALRDLLDLEAAPRLEAWHREGDQDIPLGREQDLGEGLPLISIGIEGVAETIQLVYYRIDQAADWIPPEERGFRAGVAASEEEMAWGGPVRLALGAGVALALARLMGTVIIDHKLSLSHAERQTAEEFFKKLSVKGPYADFKTAAEALFHRTPLKALNGQRLRILEIERDVDGMMIELLGPIRLHGKVEGPAFERFFALVDEWLTLSVGDSDMATKLEGVLILVDEFLRDEAQKAPQAEELLTVDAQVRARREKVRALSA